MKWENVQLFKDYSVVHIHLPKNLRNKKGVFFTFSLSKDVAQWRA
jgi:hypothetical protein